MLAPKLVPLPDTPAAPPDGVTKWLPNADDTVPVTVEGAATTLLGVIPEFIGPPTPIRPGCASALPVAVV